jgi:hypothetical protein
VDAAESCIDWPNYVRKPQGKSSEVNSRSV